MTTTWSLVSTMLGVPETVLPCVAHHLNSDVDRLHVYLDAPSPQIEEALAAHPRCVVTVCDVAYWAKRLGERPDGLVRRQLANVEHARQNSSSDWLVHIDSDEFLVSADPTKPLRLGASLQNISIHHDWVRIAPMERVLPNALEPHSIFDGVFRGLSDELDLIAAAYGEGAAYLHRGLSGHVRGKIGFRRQTKFKVRIHDVIRPPRNGLKAPIVIPVKDLPSFTILDDVLLLHFDGWSPLQWASKLVRFAEDGRFAHHKGRRASVRFVAEHPTADARLGLFDRVQRLTPKGMALLSQFNLLRQSTFDPSALTKRTFPSVEMDFGVGACDARLRASSPEFYSRNGL